MDCNSIHMKQEGLDTAAAVAALLVTVLLLQAGGEQQHQQQKKRELVMHPVEQPNIRRKRVVAGRLVRQTHRQCRRIQSFGPLLQTGLSSPCEEVEIQVCGVKIYATRRKSLPQENEVVAT